MVNLSGKRDLYRTQLWRELALFGHRRYPNDYAQSPKGKLVASDVF